MTKTERLRGTLTGEPVDRVAVALWRHFPGDDQSADDLAEATLDFQRRFDWDFIKVSPASSFCLVDWGVEDDWVGGDEGTREYRKRPVTRPEDWGKLPVLDPAAGRLADQLRCLALIGAAVGTGVPFIQTVFNPLGQAKNLAGVDRLLVHMRERPAEVHAGLETITRSTIRFVEHCTRRGISGIYYAVQLATRAHLSDSEYAEFGEPYDRRVLDAAGGCWFNMLHLHGTDVMFDRCARYPVHAINWHDRETAPTLRDGLAPFPGAVCGGLARWEDLLRGDPDSLRARVRDAIEQTGGRRLIIASGCVAPVNTPHRNLRAVRSSVESLE